VHGFCCYDNIDACKLIALYTANAYSAEREISASARTRSMPGWATVCKTVRPMLSDRCLSVLFVLSVCPICDVGVLWPNGWIDPDETWCAGRPQPRRLCVRWGPSLPTKRRHPNFRSMSIVAKRLDGSKCHLVRR